MNEMESLNPSSWKTGKQVHADPELNISWGMKCLLWWLEHTVGIHWVKWGVVGGRGIKERSGER